MAKRNYGDDPFNKPQDDEPQNVTEMLFGKIDIPESGREVVRALDIMTIYPDSSQPRRAIPMTFRKGWLGQPNKIPDMFVHWKASIEQRLGMSVTTKDLILGADFPTLPDGVDGDIQDYFDLVSLANSIYKEGLTNPIATVQLTADSYLLVAGERRFLAFHLLNFCRVQGAKDKIPCRVLAKKDVWAQASENGARKPLNAIGMARQLALLILDMYQGENGLNGIDEFIKHERPDREYYAQVANGNVWRIKKGMLQRILDVTGVKNADTVADYRRLLSLDDTVWERADAENWALGRIQTFMGWIAPKKNTSEISDVSAQQRYDQPPQYEQEERPYSAPVGFNPPVANPREIPSFSLAVPTGSPDVQLPPKPAIELAVQLLDKVVNERGDVMLIRSKVAGGVYVSKSMLDTRNAWVMWLWGTFTKIEKDQYRPMTQAEKDAVLGNMMGDEPLTPPSQRVPQPAPQPHYTPEYSTNPLAPDYLKFLASSLYQLAQGRPGTQEYLNVLVRLKSISDNDLVMMRNDGTVSTMFENIYNIIAHQFEAYLKDIEGFLMECANRANELE